MVKTQVLLEEIIGKHAIKLKIHATTRDLKQENSKSTNKTRMISYPNRRDLSPSRPAINQQKTKINKTDPNDNKAFEHSNQVRKLIFEGERERKSVGSLGMLGFGV